MTELTTKQRLEAIGLLVRPTGVWATSGRWNDPEPVRGRALVRKRDGALFLVVTDVDDGNALADAFEAEGLQA